MTGAVVLLVLAALDVASLCSIMATTSDEKMILNHAEWSSTIEQHPPFGVKQDPLQTTTSLGGEEQGEGICPVRVGGTVGAPRQSSPV